MYHRAIEKSNTPFHALPERLSLATFYRMAFLLLRNQVSNLQQRHEIKKKS